MVDDLVTVFRKNRNNPMHRRRAMVEGHKLLGTAEQYHEGSADAQACTMSAICRPNYEKENQLARSYVPKPEQLLAKYLDRNYNVHPEAPVELMERIFLYEQQPVSGIATLVLNVGRSLSNSLMNLSQAKSSVFKDNFSVYEAILEAEKELGNNPAVLREAVETVLGKKSDVPFYTWVVPRNK